MGTNTIMFLIIFILISFNSSHIFVVNGEGYNDVVPKSVIFEKISAFFRFKGLDPKTPSKNWNRVHGSLSPSPAPAPAPAPVVHTHLPRHHPLPERVVHAIPQKDENGGRVKRVLIAVFVSVGAAFVIFSLGFVWVCKKLGKKRKNADILRVLARRNGGSDKGKSVKRVRSEPGSGRFYLESIETAFKPHPFFNDPKNPDLENVMLNVKNAPFHENSVLCVAESSNLRVKIESFHEDDEHSHFNAVESSTEIEHFHDQNAQKSDSEEVDSKFGIVSFHEKTRSTICSNRFGDECSSEDESFHSFSDSHSPNIRLSNASSENLSPKGIKSVLESASSSKTDSTIGFRVPPPPPPPPPYISHSHSSSRLSPNKSKLASPTTLPFSYSPTPTNSDSSSGSNQTPQRELPPKHMGGIPPPPCPPPQLVRLGKDGTPLAKLKPLHWDKVRAAPDRSMVWDKLRANSFEFDEEMMESLFRYNLQGCSKSDESKSPSPTKHLLEPKRLQNITILSKALNITAEQVCEALIQGEGLCLQQLEALAKMVPTSEEEDKLLSYKGDINGLNPAEIFVKTILNIPLAFSRIEAMLYRETFDDEVVHLRRSFSMLEEACKELRSSRLFLKLLEAVLKTGNRMNVGTMRGGARAFKLDALLKLADVKGTDGKTTLLHFVVQEIVRSEGLRIPESIMGKINLKTKGNNIAEKEEVCRKMGLDLVAGLSTELCNVKKTATIGLDVLATSVSNLSDGMIKLNLLLGNDLFRDEKSERFSGSMRSFVGHAEKNLEELREYEERVLLRVREVTEYFHGNLSKDEPNPLRIFVIVRDFLGMLDNVCKELRSSKLSSSPNPLSPFR